MSDTTAPPTAAIADPGPPPPTPPGMPRLENRFYVWLRGLGVPRSQGWLGGVCAGLSARMGIDPVIVRGIFVVAALVGFPALLVYAIAWALLPDADGRIHLQQLGRGRFEPALIAIAIMLVVSFVPVVPWLWSAIFWPLTGGYDPFDAVGYGPFAVINTLLTILLVGAVVALVTWLIVRASKDPRGGTAGLRMASTDPTAPGSPAPQTSEGMDAAARGPAASESPAATPDLAAAGAIGPEPVAPAPPGDEATASEEEITHWRARQEEWRAQHDAWRRQQLDEGQAARARARAEREAAGRVFAAEAEERRRIRRATKPRTSFVFVVAVIGAALVGGALAALAALDTDEPLIAGPVGLLVAAGVTALGMVIAGIARRRSGFLTAIAIVTLCAGLIAALVTSSTTLLLGGQHVASASMSDQSFAQPFGSTTIETFSMAPDGGAVEAGTIALRKGSGDTWINVQPGVELRVKASLGNGTISFQRIDLSTGELTSSGKVAPESTPRVPRTYEWRVYAPNPMTDAKTVQPIVIERASGSVTVTIYEP